MAAGATVAVAAPASFADQVNRAGFAICRLPESRRGDRRRLRPVSQVPRDEANRVVIAEVFARLDAQTALPALTAMMAEWAPDIVLRETCEFAAMVAADRAAIPQVHVAIGMGPLTGELVEMVEQPLAELSEWPAFPGPVGWSC